MGGFSVCCQQSSPAWRSTDVMGHIFPVNAIDLLWQRVPQVFRTSYKKFMTVMHDPTKVTSKQMLLLYVYVCMYIHYIYTSWLMMMMMMMACKWNCLKIMSKLWLKFVFTCQFTVQCVNMCTYIYICIYIYICSKLVWQRRDDYDSKCQVINPQLVQCVFLSKHAGGR